MLTLSKFFTLLALICIALLTVYLLIFPYEVFTFYFLVSQPDHQLTRLKMEI